MVFYKLTAPQKNIWGMRNYYGSEVISNICGAALFETKLDKAALEQAVNEEIRMRDSLRMRMSDKSGETVQYVCDYRYEKVDFKEFADLADLDRFGEEYARIPFESYDAKLYRFTVFEVCGRSGVIACMSHLISDAHTFSIMANSVFRTARGEAVERSECSYTDFIKSEEEYLRSEKYQKDKAYWTDKYRRMPEASPIRFTRISVSSAASERYTTAMSAEMTKSINTFCEENNVSQAVLFEAAVIVCLSKINPENRSVTIGTPILNRSGSREKNTAGMFVSTLPLTIEISENETALSLCAKTAEEHRRMFRHRKLPYSHILHDIRERTGFSGRLYDVMVSCQTSKTNIGADTRWYSNGFSDTPFVFHTDDRDSADRYTVTIDYLTEVFPQDGEIPLITERIFCIIRSIISDKSIAIDRIPILPVREYQKIIFDFNSTAVPYPKDRCVHQLFAERAKMSPDAAALYFEGNCFSYRQLDEMSNSLARRLREKGVKPNFAVPIMSVRSPYIIIAMLGVLKAGGAYMPVSPDYPEERVEYMLKAAAAKLVLTCGCSCKAAENIPLDSFDYSRGTEPLENVNRPDDMCYMIFTSGSTGRPKGTAITHKNVVNYCCRNSFNVCGNIIEENTGSIVSVTNFIFDIFVTESLLPLLNGIVIYLANDEQVLSQERLGRLITDNGITTIQTTPTKMRSYIFDKRNLKFLSVLKTVILGGEEFPRGLYDELVSQTSAKIFNIYGPAETTVWSAFKRAEASDISIGRPIANTRIYILDRRGRPVPIGIAGELCIAGDGVGKGYPSDPKLTSEKFLPDPFFGNGTMYRTGDLARILANGNIEFLGRIDSQVKINGLRIELGEIESIMNTFDRVCLAAASDGRDAKGRQYLAGYYVSENAVDEKALRAYLASKLPSYMVPNYFVRLDEMPVTASGKTDRKRLPAPETNIHAKGYEAPKTKLEKKLCRLLAELLETDRVGAEDDFFDIGGDSLKAIEYAAAAHGMGIDFSLKSLFECRTVRALCACITEGNAAAQTYSADGYPAARSLCDMILFKMFAGFTKLAYKLEAENLEKLDPSARYIFCPNHESDLDCLWVWTAVRGIIDLNKTSALIAREHLDHAVSRCVFRIAGGIPIDRSGDFVPAMKRALEVIKAEKSVLLIHPEGTRTRTGELGKFKQGAALLSINSGVPTVPVCIIGAHDIFPPGRKLPRIFRIKKRFGRYPLRICFGEPIEPSGKSAEQITDEIRRQIVKMKNGG